MIGLGPSFPVIGQSLFVAFYWVGQMIKLWWWIALPFFLFPSWRFLYKWHIQNRWGAKRSQYKLLEIKLPEEVKRPIKAMEQVFSHLWSVYDPSNFKEEWIDGKFLLNFSLEIVGIDGKIHFLIRSPIALEEMIKSIIYSQYPEVEIIDFPDYTQQVPQKLPNREWRIWGCNYRLNKADSYPIKTYEQFFEKSPEAKEEKRVDPLASLLEGMAMMKKGEQLWIQIVAKPITDKEDNWISRGRGLRDKLTKRTSDEKRKSILRQVFETLFLWRGSEEAVVEKKNFSMMEFTSAENRVIEAIEDKIAKYGFQCTIRFLYLGKGESFFKPRIKVPINFFVGLSTEGLNGLRPWMVTTVYYPPHKEQRIYFKKRDLFWHYIKRLPPLFPKGGGTFVLNTEELATIFHFPGKIAAPAPSLERIRMSKGEPPLNLPVADQE